MEESCCQNKEDVLEDAMRSSHHSSSSLSDWEVVSMEHDKPPSPIDCSLNDVSISEDGKVKLFEGQPNNTNSTQQKVEETVKENMSVCSCQKESPKEVKCQSLPSSSEYADSVNQESDVNKKSNLKSEERAAVGESSIENQPSTSSIHCETSGAVEENVESAISDSSSFHSKAHENGKQITELQLQPRMDSAHGVYNKLSDLASAGDETTSDETKLIKTDKNVTQNPELSGEPLSVAINTISITETPENVNASSIANTCEPFHNDNNHTDFLDTDNGTNSDKIKLLKKDKHWILCFGMTETVLKFEETETVYLEVQDKNVYLRTNSTVYEVTANQIGEATVTQLQEADVVSASTASGTQNESEIPKDASTPLMDISEKNMKEEIDAGLTRPNYSAGKFNNLATEQFEDKGNYTQPNQNIIEQLKMGKDRLLKEGIEETALESEDQNGITMYHADGDFYIKSNNDLYEVKFEADDKTYLVPIRKAIVIPLAADSSDLKVGNVDDSDVSGQKKEHETVMDKACKRKRIRGEEERKPDKIKLLKKDKHWILCFGLTETVLRFEDTETVNLEIQDKNVYLRTNSTVYEVTANQIGEATVTKLQEADVVSASTSSSTQNETVIPKDASTPLMGISGKTMEEEIDAGLTRPIYSVGKFNNLATEQFEDKGNYTQPNQNIIEQLKMGKDRLLKEGIAETTLESEDQNGITMYHADDDFYIKSNNGLYEVKFEADEKTYLVPIREAIVIPLAADSSDVKVGNVDDSYVSDQKKEQETVMDKASKRERIRDEEERMSKKMVADVKGDVDSSNEHLTDSEDQAGIKTPSVLKLANDDVSAITDMLGKLDINQADSDGMGEKTCLTSESQRVSNDSKNNANFDIEESKRLNCLYETKEVNVAVHEAVTQAVTHDVSNTHTNTTRTRSNTQPIDTVCSSRTGRSLSTSDTDVGIGDTAPLTGKIKDTGVNAEKGARPKQTTKSTSQKNQDATLSLKNTPERATDNHDERCRVAAKFPNTVHNVPGHELGIAHVEKSPPSPKETDVNDEDLRATFHQTVEEESIKGRECVSVGVKVDSIKDFIHLKHSKAVAQLAKDSGVIIKSSQMSDCQGFEIEGDPRAVMKCESDLKNVIKAITSASIILKGGRKSASEIKDNLSRMKTEVAKRFDVSLEFSAQISPKQPPGNGKPSADSKSKQFSKSQENEIEKVERPNLVYWQFPGGYKISLYKESVEQSTAVVHVEFKSWNGKEKQLDSIILPDRMGGYTVKVKAGLPRCRERNETEELKRLFDKILEKAGNEDHNSVAFSVEDIQNWTLVCFLECLLPAVWNHFKAPKSDKPVFIELCNPKIDEYAAINYHCHGLISKLMEKEIGCIKSKPLEIRVIENKLNCTEAEVLVNTTSKDLQLDSGAVSSAMLKTAGDGLQAECITYYPKGIEWGEMAVTMGHGLPSKYVFHGALPPYHMHLSEMDKLTAFRSLMDSCLTKAKELGCKTIAFPVLGAGILKYPVALVAAEMFTCVQKFQQIFRRTTLQTVYFVVYPADKDTLQIFREMESIFKDAETETAKQKEQEQPSRGDASEQKQKQDDVVEHVKAEIIGHHTVVEEASKYTKAIWRKRILEEENLYAVRLPSRLGQDISYRQDKRLTQQLADLGAEISETNSEYFITATSLKTLEQSYAVVNQLLTTSDRKQSFLGPFDEIEIIAKLDNVNGIDFKVMEKINKSTLDKYAKIGSKIFYDGKCVVIQGKAKVADSIRTEVQKLCTFIKTLNPCCIDVRERKIGTEMINAIAKEIEARNENACILFEKEEGQIKLFSNHKQTETLVALKKEILEKISLYTKRNTSEKSNKQFQPNIENAVPENKNVKGHSVFQIKIPTRSGSLKVFVYEGDLLKAPVACIVNAANEYLAHNAGVAAAVANAAGTQLRIDSQSHFSRYGKVTVGNVVVTTAGNLKYKCVIHAVGPNWREYTPLTRAKFQACKDAISSAVRNSMIEVEKHRLKSVAIPAISSGYQGVPIDICAQQYAEAIGRYLQETARPCVEEIHFVDVKTETVAQIAQTFQDIFVDEKVISYDSKYLQSGHTTSEIMLASYKEHAAVKYTGRPKTEHGNVSHSGQNTSLARAELHPKTEKAIEAIPTNPLIYQSPTNSTVIRFSSYHEIQLYTGNVLLLESVDALVLREDLAGTAKGHIAQEMEGKGGPKYVSAKKAAFRTKLAFGEVIVTAGGNSQFSYVFHALVHHRQHFKRDLSRWYDAFQKILGILFNKAVYLQCRSIAMPLFGIEAGQYGDVSEYAKVFVESFKNVCTLNTPKQLTVHLISNEPSLTAVLQSAFQRVVNNKSSGSGSAVAVYPPVPKTEVQKPKTGVRTPEKEVQTPQKEVRPPRKEVRPPRKEDRTPRKEVQTPQKEIQTPQKEVQTPRKEVQTSQKEVPQMAKQKVLSVSTSSNKTEDCVICLDKMTLPNKLSCGHTFCKDCIGQHMKTKKNCPICGKVFGEITGNQPTGQMNIRRMRTSLPGYERYDTIAIEYAFPSGTQGPEHPEPGKHYQGITRTAYLPDNTDGRQVLKLLEVAFERKLTFTIGQSRTTGHSGVITWNDIHHKTNPKPNTQFGYPDPGYFERVKDELAAKGVTVDDIK